MKNILITGSGGSGVLPIWCILKKKYNLFFADSDLKSIDPLIPKNKTIKVPPANNSKFIYKITKILKNKKIDVLVPTVDEEVKILAKQKNLGSQIFIPDKEFVNLTLDKYMLQKKFQSLGLPFIKTYLANEKFNLNNLCIIKPRVGRGSRMVHILKNSKYINSYINLYGLDRNQVIVQKYISGSEYTVFVHSDSKKILKAIIPVKVILKKNITIKGLIVKNKLIFKFIKQLSKKIPTVNCYNVQLKIYKNKIYPFEINPRISTTFFSSLLLKYDPFKTNKKHLGKIFIPNKKILISRHWNNFFDSKMIYEKYK